MDIKTCKIRDVLPFGNNPGFIITEVSYKDTLDIEKINFHLLVSEEIPWQY